jgi:hypothetical protein
LKEDMMRTEEMHFLEGYLSRDLEDTLGSPSVMTGPDDDGGDGRRSRRALQDDDRDLSGLEQIRAARSKQLEAEDYDHVLIGEEDSDGHQQMQGRPGGGESAGAAGRSRGLDQAPSSEVID